MLTFHMVSFSLCRLAYKVSTNRRNRRLSEHPISVLEFNSQFRSRFVDGELEAEYELLQARSNHLYEQKSRRIGQEEANKAKNRFVDIVPCESSIFFQLTPSQFPLYAQ